MCQPTRVLASLCTNLEHPGNLPRPTPPLAYEKKLRAHLNCDQSKPMGPLSLGFSLCRVYRTAACEEQVLLLPPGVPPGAGHHRVQGKGYPVHV